MKMNTKQNDNTDAHCENCSTKNVQKGLVKYFDSDNSIMMSCNNKCIVKIGVLGFPLAIFPKTKAVWVEEAVEVVATDHDTFKKSNLVHDVLLRMDVPNDSNL